MQHETRLAERDWEGGAVAISCKDVACESNGGIYVNQTSNFNSARARRHRCVLATEPDLSYAAQVSADISCPSVGRAQ